MTVQPSTGHDGQERARRFNLYDPEAMRNPHELWQELRDRCPVAFSEELGGYWMITRYQDIRTTVLDTSTFSSKSVMVPRDRLGPVLADEPPITLDPPRHTAFRSLLLPGFAPARVARLEPTIRSTCRTAIAEIGERGHCDITADYAKKIPVDLICNMLGVPPSIGPTFNEWIHDLVEADSLETAAGASAQMAAWMTGEIEQHKQHPRDDLISLLMESEVDGQRLSQDELIAALLLILIGGMDTVWSVVSNMLRHLAEHEEDRSQLLADPSLIPSAVEEFLRFYAPISLARITTTATTVAGVEIGADESVLMCYPSANRDAAEFPEADRVILDRTANRHLAFGIGPHRCIGSNIARLELRVALEEWLAAFPDFSLTEPGVTWSTGQVWGPRSVPVRIGRSSSSAR